MRFVVFLLAWLIGLPAFAEDETPKRVGVIGRVTSIDPLIINGLQIDVTPDTPVLSPLGPRSGKTLRLGHTLAATVERVGARWRPVRLLHVYPLVGPVTSHEDGILTVMGSQITAEFPGMFVGIKPGYWVGVSGLWNGETLIASRAGAIPQTGFAQLSGTYVEAEDETSNPVIGGTSIVGQISKVTTTGDLWALSGAPQETSLKVSLKTSKLFASDVDLVLAEGYPSDPIASETYTVQGTGLIGYAVAGKLPDTDRPGRFCAAGGTILNEPPEQVALAELADRLGCFRPLRPRPKGQNYPR